jgi:hypothetical protein
MRAAARDTVVRPASIGWCSDSRVCLGNSGCSSRNSTPRCTRLTSPGLARAAAGQRGLSGGMVRPAERWAGQQAAAIQHTGDAVHHADLQRLGRRKIGQQPGQPRREHRLAGAGRSDQQEGGEAGGDLDPDFDRHGLDAGEGGGLDAGDDRDGGARVQGRDPEFVAGRSGLARDDEQSRNGRRLSAERRHRLRDQTCSSRSCSQILISDRYGRARAQAATLIASSRWAGSRSEMVWVVGFRLGKATGPAFDQST